MLHRDIKPDNIFVFDDNGVERAVFGDLGLMVNMDEMHNTDTGTFMYKAPEMLDGSPEYDKSVDVWALGCTLYYMFTGFSFVQGNNCTAARRFITNVGPNSLNQQRPLKSWQRELLSKMIVSDVAERWTAS